MGTEKRRWTDEFRENIDLFKENLTKGNPVVIGSSIAFLVLVVFVVVGAFSSFFIAHHDAFRTLALSLAALIGLPLLIWRGVSLSRSSKAAEQQAENSSKSHVADTYSRAIEQLGAVDSEGNPKLELRLGGLYALERIALANKDYHPEIMEVLCAYVRLHCPLKVAANIAGESTTEENDLRQEIKPLRIDIQACLTVIGRRETSFDKGGLDLSGVGINGASLTGANLSKAVLSEANLSRAKLSRAKLNLADLDGAKLNKAILIRANLIEADLSRADLSNANLSNAVLSGSDLSEANLNGAKLNKANLSGADFTGVTHFTCRQIQSAKIDRDTKFPDYIKITWAEDDTYTCE